MKNVLILAFILTSVSVSAQYSKKYNYMSDQQWKTPQLYIPTSILMSTFTINNINGLSPRQRDSIAITGVLTSVVSYLILQKIKRR